MPDEKPFFRFHPGAYERGSFAPSDDPCDVCSRPAGWLYTGIIYVAGDKPAVCARCIADGKLAAHLGGRFSLHDADFDGDPDAALADEVMQRTPGFSTFNAFMWPVRKGKPLAYAGHADEDATWSDPSAVKAIRKLYADEGEPLEGRTPYALVFRELSGSLISAPCHIAILDLD